MKEVLIKRIPFSEEYLKELKDGSRSYPPTPLHNIVYNFLDGKEEYPLELSILSNDAVPLSFLFFGNSNFIPVIAHSLFCSKNNSHAYFISMVC